MHHDMGATMAMLSGWVRLLWVAVLVVVAALHVWHAILLAGQSRWWHGVHTVMAVGMIAMYAGDPMGQTDLDAVLLVFFALAAVVLIGVSVLVGFREGALNPLWALAAVDAAVMAFMAAVMVWPRGVGHSVWWIVVGWLCVEAIGWLVGGWDRLPVLQRVSIGLPGHDSPDVRVGLSVMSVSMAYMLVGMA